MAARPAEARTPVLPRSSRFRTTASPSPTYLVRDEPDRFSQLNSGFLIGASSISIDDAKKIAMLHSASLNGGAQSQGEIKLYLDKCAESGETPVEFAVRCELSIEPDNALRAQRAMSRRSTSTLGCSFRFCGR